MGCDGGIRGCGIGRFVDDGRWNETRREMRARSLGIRIFFGTEFVVVLNTNVYLSYLVENIIIHYFGPWFGKSMSRW